MRPRHRLSWWDRLRGWHVQERRAVYEGEVVGVTLVRVRNYCGCEIGVLQA